MSVFRRNILIRISIIVLTAVLTLFIYYSTFESMETLYSNNLNMSIITTESRVSEEQYNPRLENRIKRILYWTTFYGGKQTMNYRIECGLNKEYTCEMANDQSLVESSHALIFHGWREDLLSMEFDVGGNGKKVYKPSILPPVRFPDQYYVLFMLEAPSNYHEYMRCYDDQFNWTMTYRSDSEAYVPYGKFELLETPAKFQKLSLLFPQTKYKLVAWVLSNCRNVSSNRITLVQKLQEHLQVDIFGKCGMLKCDEKDCKVKLGKQYKFYLALENNLCQDYMTEKVFHAYQADMVPIVYGSASYNLFLPPGSYISMNSFPSAKSLADYLIYLDRNPAEYAKYFQWKERFRLIAGFDIASGYCQICEKLHLDYPLGIQKIIPNMTEWLVGNGRKKYRACSVPLEW